VTLTSARVTGVVLLAILALALALSLVFERRSFCNYLCPIGGFTGLYAQVGPVELRAQRCAYLRRACRKDLLPCLSLGPVPAGVEIQRQLWAVHGMPARLPE